MILSLLIIAIYSLISYFLLIPFLGFYGDDWFLAYVGHFYDPQGLIKSLAIDRPFGGYLYAFIYPLIGDNVLLWHIHTFLLRLLGGYALFFVLLKVWPSKFTTATLITLIFLIYPGFLQQPLPLGYYTYSIGLLLWISSVGFTVLTTKSLSKFRLFLFTLIAIILQFLTLLNLEFFIGMEVFRLLIITYILKSRISFRTIKDTLIYWGPYIVGLVIFVLWRIFIFKSTREVTNINWVLETYYTNPIWILSIPLELIYGFVHTLIFAYFIPIIINFIRIPLHYSLIAFILGLASSSLLFLYYKVIKEEKNQKKDINPLFIIGIISICASLIPIIVSGRIIRVFLVYDRYTITSIIGVAFVFVGLLSFKLFYPFRKWIMITLVFLSLTSHLMNGFYRVDNWDKQKDLWWQLYWRAPNIQNNAMLILDFPSVTQNIPFKDLINKVKWYRFYWVDYQIWAPGNLFFNNNNSPQTHFSGDFLEDKGIIDKIRNQTVESITDRNITYIRDFRNTIIISTPSDTSCLWILDKERNELPSRANELLKTNIAYSDVNKLVKSESPITPPKEIFGSEPPHNWCYYFQKASLARQLKDWDKLSQLKKEVIQKNLKPKDPNEWLPFQKDLR